MIASISSWVNNGIFYFSNGYYRNYQIYALKDLKAN